MVCKCKMYTISIPYWLPCGCIFAQLQSHVGNQLFTTYGGALPYRHPWKASIYDILWTIRKHFHMFVYNQTPEMWNPLYSGWLGDGTAISCSKCSQVADLIHPWISYIWFLLRTHMGCLSVHIPQPHSSGVTNASCSSPDHQPQQKSTICKLTLSPHCKLMPPSSKHSPTSSLHKQFSLV